MTPTPAAPRAASTSLALVAIVIAGAALRVWLSRTPLWNDEIWSIFNLDGLAGPWGVLWDISHDNNHFLNSLWLYSAAPLGADPSWLRTLSLAAGIAAIAVMARLGARSGATLPAAALTALSFFQILYSAEARGYACATLALIVAFDAMETALASGAERGRLQLASAAGLGFFSHLAFGPAIALLGVAAFAEALRRMRSLSGAFRLCWRLFWPAALTMAPTLGFVAAGYVHKGGFTVGFFRDFSAARAIGGYVNLEMATFGLDPTSFWPTMIGLVALPALALAAIVWLAAPERRLVYGVMIFLPPALALLAHLPNTHVPRYFFATSPVLLRLAADGLTALWRRGPPAQFAALLLLAAAVGSDASAFLRMNSGAHPSWADALRVIDRDGDRTLATSFDFNVGKSVAYFNRAGGRLDLVASMDVCRRAPGWFIRETDGKGDAEGALEIGAPACRLAYRLIGVYDRDIPDQLPWALYRRDPPG